MSIRPGDMARLNMSVMPVRFDDPRLYCESVGMNPYRALKGDRVFVVAVFDEEEGWKSLYDRNVVIIHHYYGLCRVSSSSLEDC